MLKLIRNISDTEVDKAIKNLKKGLDKYVEIMRLFKEATVSEDSFFQKKYKGFYRIRFLKSDFITAYFAFLEEHKNSNPKPTFTYTLKHFYEKFNSFQYSFITKLLATLNPNLPVWDSKVLTMFGLKNPSYWLSDEEKIKRAGVTYEELIEWYTDFNSSEKGHKWKQKFDDAYRDSNITPTKKIDLILWKL